MSAYIQPTAFQFEGKKICKIVITDKGNKKEPKKTIYATMTGSSGSEEEYKEVSIKWKEDKKTSGESWSSPESINFSGKTIKLAKGSHALKSFK